MELYKEILRKANIIPDLHLVRKKEGGGTEGTGPHRVKIIDAKVCKIRDYNTGAIVYGSKLLVEENGEKKKYTFSLKNETGEIHYLVKTLADFKPGDEIVMEFKREGKRGFIDVRLAEKEEIEPEPAEIKEDDIPIIESENYGNPPPEFDAEEDSEVS